MTPKNRTLEGKNRMLGGREGGSKIVENCRTSFMYVPLANFMNESTLLDSLSVRMYLETFFQITRPALVYFCWVRLKGPFYLFLRQERQKRVDTVRHSQF